MGKLRYGIIGTGGISPKHLNGYSALGDEVEIKAACDIDERKLKERSDHYSIEKRFVNYKDLLADKEIDFVSVCLPNYLHALVTIEALEAGKHVHCEKPMAMNAAQAQAMVDAMNRTGNKMMVGLNNRFTPNAMFVKRYIDGGNLGDIYLAKTAWVRRSGLPHTGWFCEKEKAGGGALIDLGVHFIDLVLYYLNYPGLRAVTAKTYCRLGKPETYKLYASPKLEENADIRFEVEELAAGFISLKNDADLMFEISWASNIEAERQSYEIYGTKGGISYTAGSGAPPKLKIYTRTNGQLVDIEPKIKPELYKDSEFRHFVNCIRLDKQPTISIPEQGVAMMKLIENIYRSAETGTQIIIN